MSLDSSDAADAQWFVVDRDLSQDDPGIRRQCSVLVPDAHAPFGIGPLQQSPRPIGPLLGRVDRRGEGPDGLSLIGCQVIDTGQGQE